MHRLARAQIATICHMGGGSGVREGTGPKLLPGLTSRAPWSGTKDVTHAERGGLPWLLCRPGWGWRLKTTRSVEDGIPTRERGNEVFFLGCCVDRVGGGAWRRRGAARTAFTRGSVGTRCSSLVALSAEWGVAPGGADAERRGRHSHAGAWERGFRVKQSSHSQSGSDSESVPEHPLLSHIDRRPGLIQRLENRITFAVGLGLVLKNFAWMRMVFETDAV